MPIIKQGTAAHEKIAPQVDLVCRSLAVTLREVERGKIWPGAVAAGLCKTVADWTAQQPEPQKAWEEFKTGVDFYLKQAPEGEPR